MATITVYPSGIDTTNSKYDAASNTSRGYTSSSSTTYAQFTSNADPNYELTSLTPIRVFYTFDLSAIPEGSTINSVSCTVKGVFIESGCFSTYNYQLAHKDSSYVMHGSAVQGVVGGTAHTGSVSTITDCGTWTLEELQTCAIRMYGSRNNFSRSQAAYARFYGATLTVDYTEPKALKYVNIEGVSKEISSMYTNIRLNSLPEGYTRAEYIESNGTQYIDTLFAPTYKTRVVIDISDVTTEDFIFGSRDTTSSTAPKQFGVYITSASKLRSDYFGTNVSDTPTNISDRTVIDKNEAVTKAFGLTLRNTAVSSGSATQTLYLFALNNAGNTTAQASMKLYSCKIYDNGAIVRNYVPCTNSNNVAGLYDFVTNTFYGNAGTGTFTAGPVVNNSKGVLSKILSPVYKFINGVWVPTSDSSGGGDTGGGDDSGSTTTYTWKKYEINVSNKEERNSYAYSTNLESVSGTSGYLAYSTSVQQVRPSLPLNNSYHVTTFVKKSSVVNSPSSYNGYYFSGSTSTFSWYGSDLGSTESRTLVRPDNLYVEDGYLKTDGWTSYELIVVKEKGDYLYDVTSESPNAYPNNGASGDYWYVKQ